MTYKKSTWRAAACLGTLALTLWAGASWAQARHPAEGVAARSQNSAVATRVRFVNESGQPVKVYWLDFAGKRKFYRALARDEAYEQQTYLTHPWLITDAQDNALFLYYPDAQEREVRIPAR